MKKSTGLLLLLMLLLACGAFYFLNKGDQVSRGDEFAVKNTDAIYQLLLSHPNGQKLALEKGADGWLIDNNPVRQEAIDLLLETIRRLHVRSKVPNAAKKHALSHLKKSGITAKALDKSGNLIKAWIIGTESPGKRGTYMMIAGSGQPYDIDIMGWQGTLRARFMLEKEAWRSRAVFSTKLKDIQSVSVEYFNAKTKHHSFKIDLDNKGGYLLTPLHPQNKETETLANPIKGKILHYLKGYESKIAENFINELSTRDSIVHTTPFCQIKLTDTKGKNKEVKLYPIVVESETTANDAQLLRNEVERYHASVNNNADFMLVQHRVFYTLFPPYSYFFEEVEGN